MPATHVPSERRASRPPAEARMRTSPAETFARTLRARRHADGLSRYLEEIGLRAEAAAARTIVELLDGRWSR